MKSLSKHPEQTQKLQKAFGIGKAYRTSNIFSIFNSLLEDHSALLWSFADIPDLIQELNHGSSYQARIIHLNHF